MKLLSIRLHPFGAITDRTYSLTGEGAQSLLGDNEFGKSTFRESLRHALFTPTELTSGVERNTIGHWFPLTTGRSASVTLKFEHAGTTYCLEKCWGGGKRSSLTNEQTRECSVDPEQVQAKLDRMRGHSLATYERIFVASQTQMTAASIAMLRNDGDGDAAVNQAAAIASGIRQIAGDVDLESLTKWLTERVNQYYLRWNRERRTPEMSRAGQGGLEHPWVNGVGEVLSSWYMWKRAETAVTQREQYESELDRLNTVRSEAEQLRSSLAPGIDDDRTKRDGLYLRETLEARVAQLILEVDGKNRKPDAWRQRETELNLVPERLQEYSDRLAELRLEKSHADEAGRAVATRQQIARIRAAQADLDTVVRQAGECKNVTQDQANAAATIKQDLQRCEVRIEAQRLTVELSTTRQTQIEAVSGAGLPIPIELEANQPRSFDASGKVVIKFEGLTVAVKSCLDEIDNLIADHAIAERKRDELLRDTLCNDLDEACQSMRDRTSAELKVTNAKSKLEKELDGRKISDWEDDERDISNIPSTRPLATINDAITDVSVKERLLTARRSDNERFISDMKAKWPNQETLEEEIADGRTELKKAQGTLANCPTFPDGFTTASVFAANLEEREIKVKALRDEVERATTDIAALRQPGDGNDDLESLRKTAEEREDQHRKELETAEQYRRIIHAINHIRGNADPFAAVANRITQLFSRLTNGKYAALSTTFGLPNALRRNDGAELPSTRLSQGTAALLAIAVRIALAEQLLKQAPMFVLMDDPFVDLDSKRRKLAAEALQELGTHTQVIVLTCHEEHANQIGQSRVTCSI
jgi:exonuclease SbcC